MSSLIPDTFAAADRLALVGLANSRALDVFRLESPSRAAASLPPAGTEPSSNSIARLCAACGAHVPPVLLRLRPARVLSGQPATGRTHLPRRPIDPRAARAPLTYC